MTGSSSSQFTAFQGHHFIVTGTQLEVALTLKRLAPSTDEEPCLVFNDETGRIVDLDLRGSDDEIAARLAQPSPQMRGRFRPRAEQDEHEIDTPKARGRPKLGVVAREVTLLPRHWDWLSTQRGGASAALRRLVDEARRHAADADQQRATREAAYNVLQALAGDLPGYEEALRALFAGDKDAFERHIANWPLDLKDYVSRLAFAGLEAIENASDTTQ